MGAEIGEEGRPWGYLTHRYGGCAMKVARHPVRHRNVWNQEDISADLKALSYLVNAGIEYISSRDPCQLHETSSAPTPHLVSPGSRLTRISSHLDLVSPGSCLTWISSHLDLVSPGSCLTWILSHLDARKCKHAHQAHHNEGPCLCDGVGHHLLGPGP